MNYFADNLRLLRLEKDITQDKMASDIGLKRSALANYETKLSTPTYDKLIEIAKYLDISIDEILKVKQTGKRAKVQPVPSSNEIQSKPNEEFTTIMTMLKDLQKRIGLLEKKK